MSPDESVKHLRRAPGKLESVAENTGHNVGSQHSQGEAIGRLEQLRRVVPVFAHELVNARRDVAQLRTENAWLQEQLLRSRGLPEESSPADVQAALHRRDMTLGESGGRTGDKKALPRTRKKPTPARGS